jgi:hypothetical protein
MKTLDLSKRHPFIPPDFRGVQYNYHFSAGILECTLRAEESPGQLSVALRVGEAEHILVDCTLNVVPKKIQEENLSGSSIEKSIEFYYQVFLEDIKDRWVTAS